MCIPGMPTNDLSFASTCLQTHVSAGVGVDSEDLVRHEGFRHRRRWREEEGGPGRDTGLRLVSCTNLLLG